MLLKKAKNRALSGALSGSLHRRDLLAQGGGAGLALLLLSLFPYLSLLRKRAGRDRPVLFVYSFYFADRLSDEEILKVKKDLAPLLKKLSLFLRGHALKRQLQILSVRESFRERRIVLLFKNQKDWERFYIQSFQEGRPLYSGCQRFLERRMRGGRLEIWQKQIFHGAA